MVTLQSGDKAPAFYALNQNGEKISLSDFKDKKLILFFYPQAGTPTCTVEACNLKEHFSVLKKKGFTVIGISPDDVLKQKKFEQKHQLPFSLLADQDAKIAKAYGVWDKKKLFGHEYMGILRTTFVINEMGKIEKIFLKPRSKMHAQEILEEVA